MLAISSQTIPQTTDLRSRTRGAYQRGRQWNVRSIEALPGGVTALDLAPGDDLIWGKGGGFKYSAGQYLYLNVPAISSLEWHPFTISSAPSDGRVTCHIKMAPMGRHTFTGKLLSLAEVVRSGVLDASDVHVNVDGPYGEVRNARPARGAAVRPPLLRDGRPAAP